MKIRVVVSFVFVVLALAATAQPVTRFRVTQLYPPTDTTEQWFIQAGNYADTVKWVPVDSLGIGGGGTGWLKDSLPVADVAIGAATNDLLINNMDSLVLEANNGILLSSEDIWLKTSGTTTFHASPFTNFNGTGYLNFEMGFIGLNTGNDSIGISIDDFNDRVFVTPNFRIDKYSAPRFPYFTDSFSSYVSVDEGRLVYNTTDNTFMFWDGSAWNNLAPSSTVPTAWESGYAIAETNTPDLQNVGTTWEALEAQSSITATGDWTFSTGTDLYTYSGDTEKYLVNFSACFTLSVAILKDFTFTVQENGSDTNAKAIQTTSGADADITYCLSGLDIVTANNTDTFGLGFKVSSSSHNVTIESSQVSFTKL